jgi:hypothetical protein
VDTGEAQKKYGNAKSISSAQFFGDSSKSADVESQARISKFAVRYTYLPSLLPRCLHTFDLKSKVMDFLGNVVLQHSSIFAGVWQTLSPSSSLNVFKTF